MCGHENEAVGKLCIGALPIYGPAAHAPEDPAELGQRLGSSIGTGGGILLESIIPAPGAYFRAPGPPKSLKNLEFHIFRLGIIITCLWKSDQKSKFCVKAFAVLI